METLQNNATQHEAERHQRDMDSISKVKCSVCDHVDGHAMYIEIGIVDEHVRETRADTHLVHCDIHGCCFV